MREKLVSTLTSNPISSFSPGVRANNLVQVSGQGSLDPETGAVIHLGDVYAQTLTALGAVQSILEAGGSSITEALMVRVYLSSRDHFPEMNRAYEKFMTEHNPDAVYPARTTVIVGLPLEGMLVEIDALAA